MSDYSIKKGVVVDALGNFHPACDSDGRCTSCGLPVKWIEIEEPPKPIPPFRQQAREASYNIEGVTSFPDDSWGECPEGVDPDQADKIADKVSDLWEPMLRECVEVLEWVRDQIVVNPPEDGFWVAKLPKIREGLGDE